MSCARPACLRCNRVALEAPGQPPLTSYPVAAAPMEELDHSLPVNRTGARWPAHETKDLTAVRLAAVKFWSNFDPNEPDTAPTNKVASEWLQEEHQVSKSQASSIATILRGDGLKAGPRPRNGSRWVKSVSRAIVGTAASREGLRNTHRSVSRTCKKFCANGCERNLGAAMVAHRSAGVAKSQSGADNMGAANRLLAELTGRP